MKQGNVINKLANGIQYINAGKKEVVKLDSRVKYAFFEGKIVPMAEAKISIATHGFMYATAVFEGIRAYWNSEQKQMYILCLQDHLVRMFESMKVMHLEIKYSVAELSDIIVDLMKRQEFKADVY